MAENTQVDVKKLSFERAIEELESIVKRLEDGKVPLEESVAIYERGEALKRRCEELLRQAEARVDKITTDANGQVTGTEPLDVQYALTGIDPRLVSVRPGTSGELALATRLRPNRSQIGRLNWGCKSGAPN